MTLPNNRKSTWTYDTLTKGIGKLASSAGTTYGAVPAYDALGRPSSLTETIDGTSYAVTTTYDTSGRPRTLAYPNGVTTETVYSATGRASQIKNAVSGLIYWRAVTVDARGNVTASELGNGVSEQKSFAPATGFLQTIQSFAPVGQGGQLQNLAYTFDGLGNLTRRQDLRGNLDETFAYDTLNRVVTVATTTPGATPATKTVSVTYDRLGNIRSRSDVGTYAYGLETGSTGGSPSDPNCAAAIDRPHAVRAVSGAKNAAYCYDANGDMTSGDGRTVTWSAFGMPTDITRGTRSISLAYGPERARFRRIDIDLAPNRYSIII